ncbi:MULTISPECIES: hypothetical protein [unclassified Methanothrix]|jgi:hypothetical protein|uniref:hypothetical protein n=1 Tax=unclassified Methanothrix TaxID=2620051 RepID=UPI00257D2437|nr:hypothetical protein [Methanosaeta sp. UBA458]
MRKNKFKIPDAMKMNGGFDLSDLELARLRLQETQMKLSGRYIPPEDRGNMISKEDALAQLQETLSGKITKEEAPADKTAIELERIQVKLNSAPSTSKAEAKRQLRRTQALLTKQSRRLL